MPELSVEERNAIQREIFHSVSPGTFYLSDLFLQLCHGIWFAHRRCNDGSYARSAIASSPDRVVAIHLARQKLAQEAAEAAKSERERRLDKCLREVALEVDGMSLIDTTPIFKIRDMIRKALES